MITIYAHIGTAKTGTTSIQSFFASNRPETSNISVYYPKAGRTFNGAHFHLQYESRGDIRFSPAFGGWADVLKEIRQAGSGVQKVLLSCEGFATPEDPQIMIAPFARLAEKLGAAVQPIYFVRAQDRYIEALYVQNVKTGHTTDSFAQFVEQQLEQTSLDYFSVAEAWTTHFRKTIVIPYEPEQPGYDSLQHILAAMDENDAEAINGDKRNPRATRDDCEIMLAVTKAAKSFGLTKEQRSKVASRLLTRISAEKSDSPPAALLTKERAAVIQERFAASNLALAQKYLQRDTLFAPQPELPETVLDLDAGRIAKLQHAFVVLLREIKPPARRQQ
jgi:hypothetical protein